MSDQTDPADLGLLEAADQMRAGRLSAVELTEACLRRIEERNGGELVGVGVAEQHHALVAQPRPRRGIGGGGIGAFEHPA